MSQYNSPTKDKSQILSLRGKRIEALKENPYLLSIGYDVASIKNNEEDYNAITAILSNECNTIRKKHINNLFYRTSISQNGFIDGMMILGTSLIMTKDIFTLYNGRANNLALLSIAKKIYLSMLVGGSEGIEYASNEIYTKLASDALKKIPFMDKIVTSLTDGFVNAVLLTRVSIIAENYCKMLYIEKDRDLYPSPKFILSTAKDLTADIINRIKDNLLKLAKNKTEDLLSAVANPVVMAWDKANEFVGDKFNRKKKDSILSKILKQ
jgi:hypothetical protein